MQTGSIGVGLNLQIATTVILLESDFNSAGDVDALDLVTRHAVHDDVKIIRLVTCSMVRRSMVAQEANGHCVLKLGEISSLQQLSKSGGSSAAILSKSGVSRSKS